MARTTLRIYQYNDEAPGQEVSSNIIYFYAIGIAHNCIYQFGEIWQSCGSLEFQEPRRQASL